MSFTLDRNELKKAYSTAEHALNFVSYFSGAAAGVRGALATVQIASGLYMAGKGAIGALFLEQDARGEAFKKSYKELIFVVHGAANKVRSEVEHQLFFPLSLALAVWDYAGMRIKYDVETEQAGQDVTMDMVSSKVRWLRTQFDRVMNTANAMSADDADAEYEQV